MPNLPDPVRRFVLTSVSSVPYLEALLLLRSEPSDPWTGARMAQRLYIGDADAARLLESLEGAGIARRTEEGGFMYSPPAGLAAVLDGVAECYASDLLGITQLIHSSIERRAQQFADAFRIKKEGGSS